MKLKLTTSGKIILILICLFTIAVATTNIYIQANEQVNEVEQQTEQQTASDIQIIKTTTSHPILATSTYSITINDDVNESLPELTAQHETPFGWSLDTPKPEPTQYPVPEEEIEA